MMLMFKCKMCGGTIEFNQGESIGVCDSCGTKQTLSKTNDDVIVNLFNRANNLRLKCEFDKAEQIYEKIVQQDDSDAEAHWGIVLCKYGIEYVEDPKTFQRIPTCHRTLFDAVTTDPDYLSAIDFSDTIQQSIYESEARTIDHIQKNILEIVKNEKPFDVFICYKETDENGKRTQDSVLANDIYYQLTQSGYKVFYAAITLEDKIGQEYEPYIFAALNSAKVLLAIGTKPEYFNAVWVKNEWSRYLKIMKKDRTKLLIPCYKDMDAYDLPEEFSHLQAQDMSKIGFINDLVRGIKKVIIDEKSEQKEIKETIVVNDNSGSNVSILLKRAYIFLEDKEFGRLNDYLEQILNQDPENAEVYLIKLMSDLKFSTENDFEKNKIPFEDNGNYKKAYRFGNKNIRNKLDSYLNRAYLNTADSLFEKAATDKEFYEAKAWYDKAKNNEEAVNKAEKCIEKVFEYQYSTAEEFLAKCHTSNDYKHAIELFSQCRDYKDCAEIIKDLEEKYQICSQNEITYYKTAEKLLNSDDIEQLTICLEYLEMIPFYKDSKFLSERISRRINRIKKTAEYEEKQKEIIERRRKVYNELLDLSMFEKKRKGELEVLLNELSIKENKLKEEYKDII